VNQACTKPWQKCSSCVFCVDAFNRITKKNNLNLGNKEETAKNFALRIFLKVLSTMYYNGKV